LRKNGAEIFVLIKLIIKDVQKSINFSMNLISMIKPEHDCQLVSVDISVSVLFESEATKKDFGEKIGKVSC
jgi:hypothetical protein